MEHHREKMKMFRSLPGVLPYDVAVLKKNTDNGAFRVVDF